MYAALIDLSSEMPLVGRLRCNNLEEQQIHCTKSLPEWIRRFMTKDFAARIDVANIAHYAGAEIDACPVVEVAFE
jgi:hypothetical protein